MRLSIEPHRGSRIPIPYRRNIKRKGITITSDNKNLETLIDKFRQFPVTATGYTYVELYDGDNLVEKLTSQYFLNEQEIAIYKDLKNDI